MIKASSALKRVIAGVGANAYGQLANIAIQLLSLPIFLHYWSIEKYGVWLTITAIPAYLSMADAGMVTVAGNRMTMKIASGDVKGAQQVFQSAQAFVLCTGTLAFLLATAAILLWPTTSMSAEGIRGTLLILSTIVPLGFAMGLCEAAYKATMRYPQGATKVVHARIAEWAGAMTGLLINSTFLAVALGMLIARIIATLLIAKDSTTAQHNLRWGISSASTDEMRTMLKPSFSFMAFPISNAMSFQGITLIASYTLGPASVGIFNTYRTVARIAVQVTSIFSHALWPELSRLYGEGKNLVFWQVLKKSSLIGAATAIGLSLLTFFAAPWIINFWTNGKIPTQTTPIAALLAYAAIAGSSHVPRIALMATNLHARFAIANLVASAIGIVIAWWMGMTFSMNGIATSMIATELGICLICLWMASSRFHTTHNK